MSIIDPNASTKTVSFGFVDTYENGHFTGWCFTNTRPEQQVILKINGTPIRTINATMIREDVKNIGVPQPRCGFDFTINLQDLPANGCTLSFHETVFDNKLENGVFYCQSGTIKPSSNIESLGPPLGIRSYISLFQTTDSAISSSSFLDFAMDALESTSTSSFVAMCYLLVLGRTPDPVGFFNSLRPDLATDSGRREFLNKMVSSMEFKSKRSISTATLDLKKLS